MVTRSRSKYEIFTQRKNHEATVDLLRIFIQNCVLFPKKTEYSFWSLSCMPSTNKKTWPRLAVVNMGVMEVLVIGHFKESTDELWGFVTVASDILFENNSLSAKRQFAASHPFVDMRVNNYKDAGQHQITLSADGEHDLRKLLQDRSVQKAAAHLNLRVMKKRATIYKKHHCSDLAKLCVEIDTIM